MNVCGHNIFFTLLNKTLSTAVLYPFLEIRINAPNTNVRGVTPSEMDFNSACMLVVVLFFQPTRLETSVPYPYLSLSNITFIYPLLLVSTLEITNCSRALHTSC